MAALIELIFASFAVVIGTVISRDETMHTAGKTGKRNNLFGKYRIQRTFHAE